MWENISQTKNFFLYFFIFIINILIEKEKVLFSILKLIQGYENKHYVKKDSQKIKKKLPKKQEKKEVVDESQEEIDNQEIEKIIDNTINEINQQGTEPKNNRNNDDE